ncbi:glycoside hydrolase family 62 protein [Trematosphaeria pertusa]|uniref:Alpha-L-arabinofuranosidase n=1 Tax=Trematosphaeria pertusa TaxID=390896 RepID=A0A6A6IG27_9PLEO|nr:glycoside hydrolase family 62 protein [Trematosphaeria pertusa]KAF2249159.1 glycoside hydrolase family 62 protein [Trematosphaeria pertusa]
MLSLVLLAIAGAAAARSILTSGSLDYSIPTRQAGSLPSSFKWSSSGALVGPKSDSRNIKGIKDPSIVYYNNRYHVSASTAVSSGYNMVYFNFTDFNNANSAPFYYLDQSAIGTGYRAAPQVFYFEPQKLWYPVYQNGNAAFSTNKDISNPAGWTAPKTFYSGTPKTIQDNLSGGYWVDMWVICDASNCHLFSSDDNGRLYRSQTPVSSFPSGMNEPVIAMQDSNKNNLFEASNVYAVGNGKYLLIVECIGSTGRYFRSWTASSLAGPWTALAATESNPFAGAANVAFSGTAWTKSISHGEIVRTQVDQTLTISPCNVRYLYQGLDPSASGDYNSLPWKLGLLTQTNSAC